MTPTLGEPTSCPRTPFPEALALPSTSSYPLPSPSPDLRAHQLSPHPVLVPARAADRSVPCPWLDPSFPHSHRPSPSSSDPAPLAAPGPALSCLPPSSPPGRIQAAPLPVWPYSGGSFPTPISAVFSGSAHIHCRWLHLPLRPARGLLGDMPPNGAAHTWPRHLPTDPCVGVASPPTQMLEQDQLGPPDPIPTSPLPQPSPVFPSGSTPTSPAPWP